MRRNAPLLLAGRAAAVLVLAACLLAGCSDTSGTPAHQVQQWASASGYSGSTGNTGLGSYLSSDLQSLALGLRERDLSGLRTACAAFTQDAENLYSELPTADVTLTNELASALTDFAAAGADCYQAPGFSSAKFAQYEKLLKTGTVAYDAALARLKSFGVG